jgi:hypothetical protein
LHKDVTACCQLTRLFLQILLRATVSQLFSHMQETQIIYEVGTVLTLQQMLPITPSLTLTSTSPLQRKQL